jgi:hypothetical protein
MFTSSRRPVVKTIFNEDHIVPTPLSGIKARKRREEKKNINAKFKKSSMLIGFVGRAYRLPK